MKNGFKNENILFLSDIENTVEKVVYHFCQYMICPNFP